MYNIQYESSTLDWTTPMREVIVKSSVDDSFLHLNSCTIYIATLSSLSFDPLCQVAHIIILCHALALDLSLSLT